MADDDGVWRSIGGRRVFIKSGQSLSDAMRECGKFPNGKDKSIETLLGKEFTGVKGQAAIDRLLEEKQGHVKAAFHRDDIGDIDLLWGDGTVGLSHIINQRRMQGINPQQLIKDLPTVINRGRLSANANSTNRTNIYYKNKVVVIAYELRGQEITAVLTAFKTIKKP